MATTFAELGLDERLLTAVETMGFTEPTPIQAKAIPILLSGTTDLVALAQTGTGKTAAFGLPLLHHVDAGARYPQALIVCPTRELCVQLTKELESFKKNIKEIRAVAVYGGAPINNQIKEIKRGVHIVVATPGRLIDLIERKAVDLEQIKYVVLDEADEMLNMGFREDIEFILGNTPNKQSTWLFSATMPPEVRQVSKRFMNKPVEVSAGKLNTANVNIDHQYFVTDRQHRYDTLKRLIDFNPGMYGLIFTRTRADAGQITERLTREGYDVDALHGDLNQNQRDKVMKAFRDKSLNLVIATDVAARGIDVSGISHVINFELPDEPEVYTHRSGRTARAGKTGVCISIVDRREQAKISRIQKMINAPMHKMEIPSGKDVCRKQFFHFMDKMLAADISHGAYATYLPMMEEKFADMDKHEVLQRLAALEFDRFLRFYENAEDLNVRASKDEKPWKDKQRANDERRRGDRNHGEGDYTELFVNLGQKDGFYKAAFLQFILDMSDLPKAVLGKINLKDTSTFLEVEKDVANKMIKAIDGKRFKGRVIRMNESSGGGGKRGGY